MGNKNKLLTVLSDAEQEALYGLPDFDRTVNRSLLVVIAMTLHESPSNQPVPGSRSAWFA